MSPDSPGTYCNFFLLLTVAAPCIDKSQGGPRITRENRAIDWRILITGHPTPNVSWTKNGDHIDDHRVIQRNETDHDGLIACLSVAKCKVRMTIFFQGNILFSKKFSD